MRIISENDTELVVLATRFKADVPIPYANGKTYLKPLAAVKKLATIMKWHNQPVGIEHPEKYVYNPNDMIAYTSDSQFHQDHIDSHVHVLKQNVTSDFISELKKDQWQLSDGFEPFKITHDPKRDLYLQEDLFPHHLAFTKTPACSPSKGCGFIESLTIECESYTPPSAAASLYPSLCNLSSPCYSRLINKTNEFFKMEDKPKIEEPKIEPPTPTVPPTTTESLFTEAQIKHWELAERAAKLKGLETTALLRNSSSELNSIIIEAQAEIIATLEENAKKVVTLTPPLTGEAKGTPPKPSTLIGVPVGQIAKEVV